MFAAKELAVLSDGAPWIRKTCEETFPGRKVIFTLDQCHGLQYADAAVKTLTPYESKRKDWMKTIKDQLNAERINDVIADLKPYLRLEAVATCIHCCKTNKDRRRCDLCRKRRLPIRSGIVEGACKQIVGSRFKQAGCRWSKAAANALLATESCIENNRWADFLDWKACRGAAA